MHCHLVAVEISVIGAADKRMQLNSLAFDQHRLKRLNTKTVQSWGAVQHHWMLANHFGQNIPNLGGFALDHFLRGLDCGRQLPVFQSAEYERLKKLQGHFLGQTALMQS